LHFQVNERKRKGQKNAARDEELELKRRKNVVRAMTKALTLIEKVVERGPSMVKSFCVTDLKALLAHDDPQRSIDVMGD
jgi:hypothetical protein